MKIKLIVFGKLDKGYFKEGANDYLERLKNYAQVEVIEISESISNDLAKNQKNNELQVNSIIEKDKVGFEYYLFDINGKNYDSEQLAKIIENNKDFKSGKIGFLIGPSDGFSNEFKANYQKISFGKSTFPHQLFRIMVLEQIYRSFKIINNEKYHK